MLMHVLIDKYFDKIANRYSFTDIEKQTIKVLLVNDKVITLAQAGRDLYIAEKSVKFRLTKMYQKTNTKSVVDLMRTFFIHLLNQITIRDYYDCIKIEPVNKKERNFDPNVLPHGSSIIGGYG